MKFVREILTLFFLALNLPQIILLEMKIATILTYSISISSAPHQLIYAVFRLLLQTNKLFEIRTFFPHISSHRLIWLDTPRMLHCFLLSIVIVISLLQASWAFTPVSNQRITTSSHFSNIGLSRSFLNHKTESECVPIRSPHSESTSSKLFMTVNKDNTESTKGPETKYYIAFAVVVFALLFDKQFYHGGIF